MIASIVSTHGHEADRIAGVWWLMFGLAAAIYVIVAGFIILAVVRGTGGSRFTDRGFIWVGGVLAPVAVLMLLAAVTVSTTGSLRKPSRDPLRVEVVGKRWWWDVTYPSAGVRTANEIHIPVGRQIELGLASDNVIHSFWVPDLAGKLDLIPGQRNVLRFSAAQAGTYRGVCAEYCGIQHARMVFIVVADPPQTFARWLVRQQRPPSGPSSDLVARGETVFTREACAGCHMVRGTTAVGVLGPDLSDLGGRRWLGSITIPNTTGNLRDWIADSQRFKPGNLMPPFRLSSDELTALVAYLESLQ